MMSLVPLKPRKIKGAFSGSSLYFLLQAGAAEGFVECGFEFEEVAGTSGGALVSSAIASGIAPGLNMRDLVLQFFPVSEKMFDKSWWPWPGFGVVKGKKIENELKKYLANKFSTTRIPLAVFTSNVDKGISVEWSSRSTPSMELAARVVDSMRIPGLFKARRIEGEDHVDGGVANNIPADYWTNLRNSGEQVSDKNVYLFLFRGTTNATVGKRHRPWWLRFLPRFVADMYYTKRFATGLINTLMNSSSKEHVDDAVWAKTVTLNPPKSFKDRGLVASNFDITREEAIELIDEGKRLAIEWIELYETEWLLEWRSAQGE